MSISLMSGRGFAGRMAVLVAWVLVARSLPAGAEPPVSKEYQVKAAFLYNFVKFVEWPAQSFPAAETPIQIGILGKNPFGSELENIVRDRKANGRGLVVRQVASPEEARSLHVVFVASTDRRQLTQILSALHGSSVLTVGDFAGFINHGGIIGFVVEADKSASKSTPRPPTRQGSG